jgi:hypothetical protein
MASMAVTDLPDPDSPTTPTISPADLQRDVVQRVDFTAKIGKLRCTSSIVIPVRSLLFSSRFRIQQIADTIAKQVKAHGGDQIAAPGKAQYHHWSRT